MIAKEEFTLHFENMYSLIPAAGGAPLHVIQDCQYLWVTCSSKKIAVFQFVFYNGKNEFQYGDYDELHPDAKQEKVKEIQAIDVPDGAHWIARDHAYAYVANKRLEFDKITKIDLTTREIVEVIDIPVGKKMYSNMVFSCGKLFMVEKAKTDQLGLDRQYLYFYDTISKTWNAESIPGRKQLAIAELCAGNDGFVYVANFNGVSITKFNAQTGAFVSTIRTNAFPQAITASFNHEVFVSSFGGMVTRVETPTNTVHNEYSSLGVAKSIACAGDSHIWFSAAKPLDKKMTPEEKNDDLSSTGSSAKNGSVPLSEDSSGNNDGWPVGTVNPKDEFYIGRLNRSDNEVVFTGESHKKVAYNRWFDDKDDWNIQPFGENDALATVFTTQPYSFKQFNGTSWYTINVEQHLVIITTTKVHIIKLDNELARRGKLEFTGQSMISTGSEDYMGDVGGGQLDQ